ncbi:hypothetical protein ABID97_001914 [Variovorax sp. OAS795]|uniref:hypothetical protein n=1 Tax=Variovorax sp. OAS795 TaxID=3034231 RepID=UPI003392FDA0
MTYPTSSKQAPAHDPDLIHSSSRSSVTTNASTTPGKPARITLRTTRLDVRWLDGDVEVRFVAHAMDMSPKARTMPSRGAR